MDSKPVLETLVSLEEGNVETQWKHRAVIEELDPRACLPSFFLPFSTKVVTGEEPTAIKNYGKVRGQHESFGVDLGLFQERE